MKKNFLAVIALMLSSAAFAQVDSTSQSTPGNDYSKSQTQTDTVSTSQSDTLSNDGSGSSQMPSSADSTGSGNSSSGTAMSDSTSTVGTSAEITDEDIRNYAEVMDSVNAMKQELLGEITDKVKGNPRITVSRYMELSKANGDEAKLTELKASPDEIAFVKEVSDFKNEGAGEISEKFQTLVKDKIGVEKYNEIKAKLETDAAMKAKYDTFMAEFKKDDETSKSGSTSAKSGAKSTTK